ncbi:hypothetical protein [Nonomuraea rhodomycinica]|uniref:Uncharacterized protein n=1 Tax=Nonomuraea rhodomycinica TaxID=1712872 RepID=A0A7Y6MGC4_9ACTN|nr:hypothetical protein [Nonomuraea rhodomycinica]NUW45586.1 hypothetical protein [Nonomuraea rhodomycinica]
MTPHTLCILAVAAACAAAAIGHFHNPNRRARQRQQRDAAARRRHDRIQMAGMLAVHDPEALFLRLLADHPELSTIRKGA